jgi:hypothetical protein
MLDTDFHAHDTDASSSSSEWPSINNPTYDNGPSLAYNASMTSTLTGLSFVDVGAIASSEAHRAACLLIKGTLF